MKANRIAERQNAECGQVKEFIEGREKDIVERWRERVAAEGQSGKTGTDDWKEEGRHQRQ